jgi:hemoglobin
METTIVNGISFSKADIQKTVESFYAQVANDPLLKVPFSSVQNWAVHLERMTHFWWVRFGGVPYRSYSYSPVEKHFLAGFNEEFLARWLELFRETLTANLRTEQSEFWGPLAGRMGQSLSMRNDLLRREHELK